MSDHLKNYPLDSSRREIRLLTILPSRKSETPIKCSLQVASLDAFPRYEAISYVWGDILEKQDILLDGCTIQVPTNVRRILQRLRHRMQRRVIWIDYVCIHQDDVDEKNDQVPLMSAIYANATSVLAIISLDNLGDNAADAIDLFMSGMMKRKWKVACWRVKGGLRKVSVGYETRLVNSLSNILEFNYKFHLAEYWTRMWTFQEYQLSSGKPPICICGDMEFRAPYGMSHIPTFTSLLEHLDGGRPQLQNRYKEIMMRLVELHWTLMQGYHLNNYRWVSDKQNRSVLDLLCCTSGRKCHDPKDKIYALYGLHPSLQKEYPPDYKKKSLSKINFETAKYILKEKGPAGLIMLDRFYLRKDRLEDDSIPSWVPDLTAEVLRSTGADELHSKKLGLIYEPCRTLPQRSPKFTEDLSVLCISGCPIGKCRPVFQFASDAKGVLAQIVGMIQMCGDERHLWDDVWEPENIPHRFLQACCAFYKAKPSSELPVTTDRSFFTRLCAALPQLISDLDSIHQNADLQVLEMIAEQGFGFLRDLVLGLYNIKVFTIHHTSFVGFGLSQQSVEEDDQVMASVGQFKMPFILRQGYGTDYNNGQVYHKLVGFAYVDGICQGSVKPNPYLDYVCTVPHEKLLLK